MTDSKPQTPVDDTLARENRQLKRLLTQATFLISAYRWKMARKGDFYKPAGLDYFRLEADRVLRPNVVIKGDTP